MNNQEERFIIYLENQIDYLKDSEMKIYRDYIIFKSLYSKKEMKYLKINIFQIQRYFIKKKERK